MLMLEAVAEKNADPGRHNRARFGLRSCSGKIQAGNSRFG